MRPVTLSRLGGGGMGDVYLAETGGRLVALKRIRAALVHEPTVLARFESEARVSMLLRHPNIVATLEHGTDAEGPFLVLEYLEGQSAAKLISRARSLGEHVPCGAAFSILHDVAEGLAFAHGYVDAEQKVFGIVHRDLSPDNILVGYDGTAKLVDFGIARILGATQLTGSGRVVGKSGYIAPELYEAHEPDPRSDVFSFGATAFQLLTGTNAFRAESEAATMRAVLSVTPPLVSELRPEVPKNLALLVARCLDKQPGLRPSMAVIARELQVLLDGTAAESVSALMSRWFPERRPAPDARSLGQVERRTATGLQQARRSWTPRLWAFLAVLLVAVGVGTWRLTRASPEVMATEPAEPQPAEPVSVAPAAEAVDATPARVESEKTPRQKPRPNRAATLRIRVTPWAEVFLDGKSLGQTPVPLQQVEPGVHSLILVNAELGVRNSYQVRVKTGEQRTFVVNLPPRAAD